MSDTWSMQQVCLWTCVQVARISLYNLEYWTHPISHRFSLIIYTCVVEAFLLTGDIVTPNHFPIFWLCTYAPQWGWCGSVEGGCWGGSVEGGCRCGSVGGGCWCGSVRHPQLTMPFAEAPRKVLLLSIKKLGCRNAKFWWCFFGCTV